MSSTPKHIHVAIGSTTSKPGEVQHNLGQIAAFARQAGKDGVDLLLTPEMSASGYGGYPEVLAVAERAGDGPIFRTLAEISGLTGVVICAGFCEIGDGDNRHIAHYIVYPDGKWLVRRKHRATPAELPLQPGAALGPPFGGDGCGQPRPEDVKIEPFDVCGVRCALTICADAGITDLNARLARENVELLLVPTGAGGTRDLVVTTADLNSESGLKRYQDTLQLVFFPGGGISECIRNRRAMAAVNMCGYDGRKQYHLGHGMIINPMGEVVGFVHGLPNLDRQRPMYANGLLDLNEKLNSTAG